MKKLIVLLCLSLMVNSAWADNVVNGSFWNIDPKTDKVTLSKPLPKTIYKRKGHVYFQDGRICKGCTVYKNTDIPDELGIVIDSHGKWYRSHGFGVVGIDEHPYARAYAQGAAMAAQQYSQQAQYQNMVQRQQQRQPVNIDCSSYGLGYTLQTNCHSY